MRGESCAPEIVGTAEQNQGVRSEFVFSNEGDWLYRLRKTAQTDIWVLDLSDK